LNLNKMRYVLGEGYPMQRMRLTVTATTSLWCCVVSLMDVKIVGQLVRKENVFPHSNPKHVISLTCIG